MTVIENLKATIHLNIAGEGKRKSGMDYCLSIHNGIGKSIVGN